ncbi:hypothetical protein BZG36_03972 [Bifiguratus adelaidae]|uniref:Uncharacterized protein n=1 Tax=Bifiguratus adelaidae TaxID=1938954 RepID=A0A261XXF0_9FUNG|nr:hypothetical protein BZG36_03972 [Bifiguratus adelaidae]
MQFKILLAIAALAAAQVQAAPQTAPLALVIPDNFAQVPTLQQLPSGKKEEKNPYGYKNEEGECKELNPPCVTVYKTVIADGLDFLVTLEFPWSLEFRLSLELPVSLQLPVSGLSVSAASMSMNMSASVSSGSSVAAPAPTPFVALRKHH